MKIKFYIYFLIFIIPLVVLFSSIKYNSFCALPDYQLDTNTSGILIDGADRFRTNYGVNADPNFIVFGLDNILSDVNQKLYNQYGWDLLDVSWKIEDTFNQGIYDLMGQNIAFGETIASGYRLLATKTANTLTGATDYILGVVDDVTGKITDVYDNVYTYISDEFVNKLTSVKRDIFSDGDIVDNSSLILPVYYSDDITTHFYFGSTEYNLYADFDTKCLYYTEGNGPNYTVHQVFPTGFSVKLENAHYSANNTTGNATLYTFNVSNFIINGVTFIDRTLQFRVGTNFRWLNSDTPISSLENVKEYIETYYPFNNDIAYSYNPSNYTVIYNMLNQLKGNYVTTDDLRQVIEKIDGLTLGNIVINNNNYPVIDTDYSNLSDLQQLIYEILERNSEVNEYLGDPEPEPEPEPEPNPNPTLPSDNQGVTIPDGFDTGIVGGITSTLEMPFKFTSIFQPLFYTFGAFSGMYAIFMFLPIIIIIAFIIWALK